MAAPRPSGVAGEADGRTHDERRAYAGEGLVWVRDLDARGPPHVIDYGNGFVSAYEPPSAREILHRERYGRGPFGNEPHEQRDADVRPWLAHVVGIYDGVFALRTRCGEALSPRAVLDVNDSYRCWRCAADVASRAVVAALLPRREIVE